MLAALHEFGRALRRAGLVVSPAELRDAAAALDWVGVQSRDGVKTALRACLVKEAAQRAAFDRLFDAFFAPHWPAGDGDAEARRKRGRGQPAARGTRGQRRSLQPPTQPGPPAPGRPAGPTEPKAEPTPARSAALGSAVSGSAERDQAAARRVQAVARAVRAQSEAEGRHPGCRPLWQRVDAVDQAALAREAERLGRWLATRVGRRWRRAAAGQVDLRATVALAARHGGRPWRIVRRQRRVARPRLLLLCDVSGSVRRASELFLRLIHELGRRQPSAACFVFVDRPVDAGVLLRARDFEAELAALDDLPALDRQALSDYGHTFARLVSEHAALLRRDTTVVVLGDARTNRFDPAAWALADVAQRCAQVIWLDPEPQSRWHTGDSALAAYEPHLTRLLPVETLAALAAALDQILATPATRGVRRPLAPAG